MAKTTAKYGRYTIAIEESGTVKVTLNGSECKNTIAALRDIAKEINFQFDTNWNTQHFGKKLMEHLKQDLNCFNYKLFIQICQQYTADEAHFTGIPKIDNKINDINNYPHLFVLACLMDRQISAEKAWKIPYLICRDLCNGDFSFNRLSELSLCQIYNYFQENSLHRFNNSQSQIFFKAIELIKNKYNSNASLIWEDKNNSAEIIYRFLQFDGCGIKIASMAANLLHRIFGIKYTDYSALDISPDIHIRRVFLRLGLIDDMNKTDIIIYKARSLYPPYPGLFDKCCWNIGRKYCHPSNPDCAKCILKNICKTFVKNNLTPI